MKKVVFTFDYELFFGKSGSVTNCMIKPTDILLDIFKESHSTATFFVDMTYLLMLSKENLIEDFDRISKQICRMAMEGHEVALHIHPHWLDAKYINGEWHFLDYSHYKIGNCDKENISLIFEKSVDLLTTIVRSVKPNYSITSFRAGGWCIDPFANIKELFEKHNIKIDSSVIPYRKCVGNSISSYDYSDVKIDTPYNFSNSVHDYVPNGEFTEFPVSTYSISPMAQFVGFVKRRSNWGQINTKRYGDGKSVFDIEQNNSLDRYLKYLKYKKSYYSCDGANENIYNRIKEDKRNLITIVSHPKCQTPLSIEVIKKILNDNSHVCVSIVDYLNCK